MRHWWSKNTVAVVTGGNKGLGLFITRLLAKHGLTVVLTARDPEKGQSALQELREEGLENVAFHPLEVCSSDSVEELAMWIRQEFGGLDILINNAAVQYYGESYEHALETIETNYYGVKRVTKALLPLMRASPNGARIVNISSQAASSERFPNSFFRNRLNNVDILTEDKVNSFVEKYLEDVKAGRWRDVNECKWAVNNFQYSESKLLLNVYTRILARTLTYKQPEHHRIFVNVICPGTVQTDMAAFVGRKPTEVGNDLLQDVFGGCTITSLEDGASTTVWLALLPRSCYPNGRFFAGKMEISF